MTAGKIYLGMNVALMAGCVMAVLQPTDGLADPAELAINDGHIQQECSALLHQILLQQFLHQQIQLHFLP